METALAAAAQNVVTSNPDDARYLIEYLKTNRLGRITFLPVSSVRPRTQTHEVSAALKERGALGVANELVSYDPQFENVISNLLGNTLIVDTLENATAIAKKYRFAFKMVTIDGDVFSTQGAMTGGSRRQDAPGLLSGDRKIEDNAAALAAKRAEMESLKAEKSRKENSRDKAFEELGILNDLINEKRRQLVAEREKQSAFEKNLSELDREIESNAGLTEAVNARILKASENEESINLGGQKLEKDKENAASSADKHQQEYDALKKQRDDLAAEHTELQVKITELKARLSSLTSDADRLKTTVKESRESNDRLKKSNEGAAAMIEQLKRDEEKVTLSKEEQDYINGIRAQIDKADEYKLTLRERLNKNGEKRDSLTEQLNVLSEKKHQEEIALAKIDSDLENMGNNI